MEFLGDDQVATYGRFLGEPTRAELERFFFLDDMDRDLVAKHRGEHNRLGFAVQMGTVRFLETFLADPLGVPWGAVDYLAVQLKIRDPSVVKRYAERTPASGPVRRGRAGWRPSSNPAGPPAAPSGPVTCRPCMLGSSPGYIAPLP